MSTNTAAQHIQRQKPEALYHFRLLLEFSDVPIAVYNHTERHFANANLAACELMGISVENLDTISTDDIMSKLAIEFPLEIPQFTAGFPREKPIIMRLRAEDGLVSTYELHAHAVVLDEIDYLVMIAYDITENLNQQQIAEFSEKRISIQHQVLADLSIHAAVLKGDVQTMFKCFKQSFEDTLKYTTAEIWVRRRNNNNLFHCFGKTNTPPIDISQANTQALFSMMKSHSLTVINSMWDDLRTSDLSKDLWKNRQGYGAVLYPIHSSGIISGLIVIWRTVGSTWHQDELTFISQAGEYFSQGLTNFVNQRTVNAAENISNSVMNMLDKPDLETVFKEIATTAEIVVGTSAALIFTKSEDSSDQDLHIFGYNIAPESNTNLKQIITNWIQQPHVVNSLAKNLPLTVYRETQPPGKQHINPILNPDFFQALLIPMVYKNQLRGGIILLYRHPRRFLSGDMNLLSTLVQQSLSAIEIIRLLAQLAEEQSHLAMLFKLNQLNTRSMDAAEISQNALDEICHTLGAQLGLLVAQEPNSHRLKLLGSVGLPESQKDRILANAHSETSMAGITIARHQTIFSADLPNDSNWTDLEIPSKHLRSVISIPIFLGKDAIAAINLGHPEPNFFTRRHLHLVESAGATVSNALIYAQLIANERATLAVARESQILANAARQAIEVLGETLDVDKVLDRILDNVAEVIDAEVYNIILIEGDHGRIVRSRGYANIDISDHTVDDHKVSVFEFESFKRMIRTGEPVIISNTLTSPKWVTTKVSRQARAYIGAAIRIGDETVGFINASSLKTGVFKAVDAQRLSLFAGYVALALRNAQTYQQTSNYASDLEQRVLSRTRELQMRTKWAEAIINSTNDGIVVLGENFIHVQSNDVIKRLMRQTLSEQDARLLRNTMDDLAHKPLPAETQLELTGMVLDLRAATIEDETSPAILITVHDITHLRALDRMKSQFVSDVSHELRTPIATIGLYANLMRKYVDPSATTYLDALNSQVAALTRLVESILQVSRYETDRTILAPEPTDLNIVCTGVIGGFETAAKTKGLEISSALSERPTMAYVDISAFKHVITHIVENAITYTDNGSVTISTEMIQERGRQWAVIAVQDTGIGIPEEEIRHIFERFYRGELPRQRQISGGGMGLALAQIITQQHGGHITVFSTIDRGSEFRIYLPASESKIST